VRGVREYSAGLRGALDTITITEADVAEPDDGVDPYPSEPV
jgi:hypothetical protein